MTTLDSVPQTAGPKASLLGPEIDISVDIDPLATWKDASPAHLANSPTDTLYTLSSATYCESNPTPRSFDFADKPYNINDGFNLPQSSSGPVDARLPPKCKLGADDLAGRLQQHQASEDVSDSVNEKREANIIALAQAETMPRKCLDIKTARSLGEEAWDDVAEEVCSIVEIAMAETALPIRTNLTRLSDHISRLDKVVGGQIVSMSAQIQSLNTQLLVLNAILDSQGNARFDSKRLESSQSPAADIGVALGHLQSTIYAAAQDAAVHGITHGCQEMQSATQMPPFCPHIYVHSRGGSPLSHDVSSTGSLGGDSSPEPNRRLRQTSIPTFGGVFGKLLKKKRSKKAGSVWGGNLQVASS